ncbi:hypothetical protein U2I54_26745 [Bacillus pseudomycoides]|uniref:Uncharacterized protein n=1 Tax=Bacillus bingmayongensis TaxID=1150157 RepID=A0ABU5K5F0_9BACI|nr:hypothetical protein [Bacillus pseudomycoides]
MEKHRGSRSESGACEGYITSLDDVSFIEKIGEKLGSTIKIENLVFSEVSVAELFFLIDQDRTEWHLQSYRQNLKGFVKELKRVSEELDKR